MYPIDSVCASVFQENDTPNNTDLWTLADVSLPSRFMIGSALYPSLEGMLQSIRASQASVVTVSLRRQALTGENALLNGFWQALKALKEELSLHFLPNTAHCRTAKEAITTAFMAREVFETHWIKLEVIGDEDTLQPHPFALVEAAEHLVSEGFEVFPYTTDDLLIAQRLRDVGCRILMPWAAPIGTGKGPINPYALQTLRQRLPEMTLIVDAGLGRPSHAAQIMEWGFDAVLLNSAVALAHDPVTMARAFALSVSAGRLAYGAGLMPQRDMAAPSTPVVGQPFWHTATGHKP